MIKGLGTHKKPFIYLDEYCPTVDWHKLHAEVSLGLAKSKWVKRFVSAGVHSDWEDQEIITHMMKKNISDYEKDLYDTQLDPYDTEAKIKYFMCVSDAVHPFWSCYLRLNKAVEKTRILNKAVGEDCYWTENAENFPSLIALISKLPFQSVGRVMLFLTESNNNTVPHFDSIHEMSDKPNDDFIWFTTKHDYKKIYILDGETKEKFYPKENSKFIWFNEMDYHGTDSFPRFSFSVRIDGKFDEEIREKILNEDN
jgi:hypothetical protein